MNRFTSDQVYQAKYNVRIRINFHVVGNKENTGLPAFSSTSINKGCQHFVCPPPTHTRFEENKYNTNTESHQTHPYLTIRTFWFRTRRHKIYPLIADPQSN